jgi:tetratricopeptide (TPR) repeat protein
MVDLAKNDPLPRIYLGNALATSGDLKGAIEQYQQVLGALPSNATAYYNLGVVFLENKDEQAAMEQFHAALKADPDFKQAHFQLANLLMRDKQHAEAIAHYTHVIQVSPDNEFARLMKAMALIRLSRYAEAKAELEEGVSALPESADLASTLARLLAACPDKSLRDGPRALRMVETLLRANPSADIELAETYAMALAASDRFSDAVELQKRMLAEVERAKRFDLVAELKKNLGLYERGETCSQPWQDVDPIFSPKPGKMELLGPKADLRMVKGVSISP